MFPSLIAGLRRLFYRLFENALVRRVMKNSGYLFSATGAAAILSFFQSILTTRLLGVANFGILGGIIMFTSLVNKFASFRMGELVIRYVGAYQEKSDHDRAAAVFKGAALFEMLASLFAFAVIWLLSPIAALLLGKDSQLAPLFALYGLIVLANLIAESSTGLLQIFNRFRAIALANVTGSAVTFLSIGAAFLLGGGLREVLIAYMIGKTTGALGLTLAAFLQAGQKWGAGWYRSSLRLLDPKARELAHFAVSTNISASLNLINKDSELLGVLLFRPPEVAAIEAGYYRLALSIANLVQLPVSPLPQATYPELAREAAKRHWDNLREVLRKGSQLAGIYTLSMVIGLVLLGRLFISLVYQPEYLPAYPALVILLVGFLVANTFYWNRTALLALGLPDFPAKINLLAALLKLSGIILFVPRYGYIASAFLLSGFYLLSVTASVLKTRSVLSQREREDALRDQPPSEENPQAGPV